MADQPEQNTESALSLSTKSLIDLAPDNYLKSLINTLSGTDGYSFIVELKGKSENAIKGIFETLFLSADVHQELIQRMWDQVFSKMHGDNSKKTEEIFDIRDRVLSIVRGYIFELALTLRKQEGIPDEES